MNTHATNKSIKADINVKSNQVTPENERRMRLFANLIIDRIYEDKRNNTLKFQSKSHTNKKKNRL